jgi:hypothetical protein
MKSNSFKRKEEFSVHTIFYCPSDTNNFLKEINEKNSRFKYQVFTVDLT